MSTENLIDTLRILVDNGSLSQEVISALLPNGRPLDFEGQLWDYKLKVPILPDNPTDEERKAQRLATAELVKDAVAFHNAYGGYVLFGVADKGKQRVVGNDQVLNTGDFNKTLQSYAGVSIECYFQSIEYKSAASEKPVELGLLLIPRRASDAPPVKFVRKGPERPDGKRAFNEEVYVRIRDECRPAANTHEDWAFLHSPRTAPEAPAPAEKLPVRSHLPARDSDLIEFVGREEQLGALRRWIGDPRSPVRLITGIGGLGKTTLAYRFAEEVIETGAGSVEWVIWLTAKAQTYSALRGKLVPTGRVDFTDLNSLFNAILDVLHYDFPVSEEEPTFAEISDRLVEALSIIPSLIIVDDLDSLSPDEQKETVAALNAASLRTVGGELPPSRILMTSRIDQGLPPTSIVKITGLSKGDFEVHLNNLCETFGVGRMGSKELDDTFEATSGSPLFAAAIVRLMKMGENRKEVIDKWRGSDGEEVRAFAFQREFSRLTVLQAKILYAVLLLNETTLNDLAEVLEVPVRTVRDILSELQAYHLIATTTKASGDSIIAAPSDLQAVTDLLQDHLGGDAKGVDQAVARANERSGNQYRMVGAAIRNIARLWAGDRPEEALIIAKQLTEKFPENGDAMSILGATLLRQRPPRYRDAEGALNKALQLGSTRPELLPNLYLSREKIEDWVGLRELARERTSNDPSADDALAAHLLANDRLIQIARVRGDQERIAELAIEAVERIAAKLKRVRLEQGYFTYLSNRRLDFARAYINAVDRQWTRAGDRLRVFEAVARLANADVVIMELLERGVEALEVWWKDVERRPSIDLAACKILSRQLGKLEAIERQVAGYKRNTDATADIESRRRELEYRGAAVQAAIG